MSVIETFETGQPVSAATFNKRVEQANQKFTQITDNLKLTQNRSALIQLDGVLDDTVSVGDLVYFNTSKGKFCPAIAYLKSTPGMQGQSVQLSSHEGEMIFPEQAVFLLIHTADQLPRIFPPSL